jgi:hypothetical protein
MRERFLLASFAQSCDYTRMPHRPPRSKKAQLKPGDPDHRQSRLAELSAQRRRDMAARSTLSRLRNRKSELK